MLSSAARLNQTGGRELKRIVFDEETIAEQVQSLGREITAAYPEAICWSWASSRAASFS